MAQSRSFMAQYNQGYPFAQQQSRSTNAFVVVNQQPSQRDVFPFKLQVNWILGFSIVKCILGSLLLIAGIVNVSAVKYDTKIAFGIWCGLTIIANGIIGCILKYKQSRCLIGAFLGLSITSLIFSISMLSFYSVVLEYFVNLNRYYCYYYYSYYGRYYCSTFISKDAKELGIGITAFLVALAVLELACSIGSVVVSCKAYSKCCSTCNPDDCCTCFGCCECGCEPLNIQQNAQPYAASYHNHQNIQMSHMPSAQPTANEPNQQRAQNNPCSDIVSFIINIPSYVFGAANGTQLSAINVNLQPVVANQQAPQIGQDRNAEQVQGATSVAFGGNQPNPTPNTWMQVDA